MFEDIIKKQKPLTVDDITWDKDCSQCKFGKSVSNQLFGLIYCEKDKTNKPRKYFCYEYRPKIIITFSI